MTFISNIIVPKLFETILDLFFNDCFSFLYKFSSLSFVFRTYKTVQLFWLDFCNNYICEKLLPFFKTYVQCTIQIILQNDQALHCTALHCTALHCTALHCTALHCTALHCTASHWTALNCTELHCTTLHFIAHHSPGQWCTALLEDSNHTWWFQIRRAGEFKCLVYCVKYSVYRGMSTVYSINVKAETCFVYVQMFTIVQNRNYEKEG